MADTDEDTQIMATSAVRAARQKVARAAAAAKEVLANGSSASANAGPANVGTAHGGAAADEKDAAADQVPAFPADTIGTPRDSSSLGFGRSVAAPIGPVAEDDWTLGNDGLSSSIATPRRSPPRRRRSRRRFR